MAFVDDVQNVFDAADFCETITIAVGHTRHSSERALRDPAAISDAATALQQFFALASQKQPPDVIASYVSFSSGASELFNALRAVSVSKQLAGLALDCLFAIVKYSLESENPQNAIQNARSVVKEIVKSRAGLIQGIFFCDERRVAKKALKLLRLVSMCHPLLAKEVVNRYDLSSVKMARSLCTIENHFCRVPFLDLVFTIITTAERDILRYMCTRGRQLLLHCLKTILDRAKKELEDGRTKKSASKETNDENRKKTDHAVIVVPSHVQRQELTAAINFLLAIERHLTTGMPDHLRRSAMADPLPHLLAQIASSELPPPSISPREVRKEQKDLRDTAQRLFIAIAKDLRVSKISQTVSAINETSVRSGNQAAVKFTLRVVEAQPLISKELLESTGFLASEPEPSVRWFAHASVISACILRLSSPSTRFAEKKFLEKCLAHEDPLIRHFGVIFTLSLCQVIGASAIPLSEAEHYIPSRVVIQGIVSTGRLRDDLGQKLLCHYQELFEKNAMGLDVHLMKVSIETAGGDVSLAADAIETALRTSPHQTVRKAIHQWYLSKLIIRAAREQRTDVASRLWGISYDILRYTDLFPKGTEAQIDVFLAVLSSQGTALEDNAAAFELLVKQAVEMPYGLYDRLYAESWDESKATAKTSLITSAIVIRLQKLKVKRESRTATETDLKFESCLKQMVVAIPAFETVVQRVNLCQSYLVAVLPTIMSENELWWGVKDGSDSLETRSKACDAAMAVLSLRGTYPKTPYFNCVEGIVKFQKSVLANRRGRKQYSKIPALSAEAWTKWMELQSSVPQTRVERAPIEKISEGFGISASDALCFLPKLILTYPSLSSEIVISNFLKQQLTQEDYIAGLSILVQSDCDDAQKRTLMRAAIAELDGLGREGAAELAELLYRSLALTLKQKASWGDSLIRKLVCFSCSILSQSGESHNQETHLTGALAFLKTLIFHSREYVCIMARVFFQEIALETVPNLVALSTENIFALLDIAPHCRSLRKGIALQLSTWSKKEHRRCTGPLLVLINHVLTAEEFREAREAISLARFCQRLIEAAALAKYLWASEKSHHAQNRIEGAVGCLGFKLMFSMGKMSDIVDCLQNQWDENKKLSPNLIMLLGFGFRKQTKKDRNTSVSDKTLMHILTLIANWSSFQKALQIGGLHKQVLIVIQEAVTALRLRRAPIYSLCKDTRTLEKNLRNLCFISLEAAHEFRETALSDEGLEGFGENRAEGNDFSLLGSYFAFTREVLTLDLDLQETAKDALTILGRKDGVFLETVIQAESQSDSGNPNNFNDTLFQISELVIQALSRLSHSGGADNVGFSLICLEKALSSESACLGASSGERDVSIRKCMSAIYEHPSRNNLQGEGVQLHQRSGFFRSRASDILYMFDKRQLFQCCDSFLETSGAYPNNGKYARNSCFDHTNELDSFFVLQTFLRACGDALNEPETAVLDLGRIAKEGLLGLAVTGVASGNDEIRALCYACLELFAKVVGPIAGVGSQSSSSLYKDRRQLAFLLTSLRNSITEPLSQALPLFATWFRCIIGVVLNPGHPSHRRVTAFLLHRPILDANTCPGLLNLFLGEASGTEIRSTRLLGLEALRKGLTTPKDLMVCRRMKIFDVLYMLAGTHRGFDSVVRIAVFNAIQAILYREDSLGASDDLTSTRGLIPWLCQDSSYLGETLEEVKAKISILEVLSMNFQRQNRKEYVPVLADGLRMLCERLLESRKSTRVDNIMEQVMRCGALISEIDPSMRQVFHIDFANLHVNYMSEQEGKDEYSRNLLKCVPRQCSGGIAPSVYIYLLNAAIDMANRKGVRTSLEKLEISAIHRYVADCTLQSAKLGDQNSLITKEHTGVLLSKALYVYPTIWLALAAYRILDVKGELGEELFEFAESIPASTEISVDLRLDAQFEDVLKRITPLLIRELLKYTSSRFEELEKEEQSQEVLERIR